MTHANQLSLKRQLRANRKLTTKGVKDGRCLDQEILDIGQWSSGEVKQAVRYLHVTKGWRTRVLPPLRNAVLA